MSNEKTTLEADDVIELGDKAKPFYRSLRIGDIILNGWASANNPLRYGVVSHKFHRPGRFNAGDIIRCIRHDGKQDEYIVDRSSRMAVVGHIRITETLDALLRVTDMEGGEAGPKDGSEADPEIAGPDEGGERPNN